MPEKKTKQDSGDMHLIYLIPAVLMTAALTFLITDHFQKGPSFVEVSNQFHGIIEEETEFKFFQDSIIASSKNAADPNAFVLEMDLNRKEVSAGRFLHFYTANLFQHGTVKRTYANFYSDSEKLVPNEFLKNFRYAGADDLSTRESYEFALNVDGVDVSFRTSGLEGDFITKNDLNYTRYLSAGTGEAKVGREETEVNIALEKIYSADNDETLYFPGIEKLKSTTHRFLLWDEEGNFYLLDQSVVSEENPYYRPHTWVLYKNAGPKFTQKFFDATIDFHEQGKTKTWNVFIPGLDTTLKLSTDDPTDVIWSSGSVGGTAESHDGTKTVFGSFSYKKE